MKKNLIITALIFIIPIIAYAILSDTTAVSAQKNVAGRPQVVKFSSKLCIDCKKLKKGFEELQPQYSNKINFTEYDVQLSDKATTDAINKYNINLVPTVIYIDKNGKEMRRTEGFVEKHTLKQYFDELLK